MADPLDFLGRMVAETKAKREADADTFLLRDTDLCMLCHAYGADKRSLFIDCGYAIHEVLPEVLDIRDVEPKLERGNAYYLLICKSCRGRLLTMLGQWGDDCKALRSESKDHDGYIDDYDDVERNIPLRVNGVTVMLTREEWDAREARLA